MAPLFPDLQIDLSGSEDEFPDVLELVRRQKVKSHTGKASSPVKKSATSSTLFGEGAEGTDKENVSAATPAPKRSPVKLLSKTPMTAATPMRRRKLGLSEKVFTNSLLQPWNESDMTAQEQEEEEEGSRTVKAKTPFVRSRDTSRADISDYSIMSVSKPQTARKHRPALLIDSSDDEDNSLEGLSKLSTHKPFDGSPSKRSPSKRTGTARPNRTIKKMPLYSLGESETEGSSFDQSSNVSSNMSKYEDGSEFLSSHDATTTSDETYGSASELFATPSKKKKAARSPSKKASRAKLSTRAIAIKAVDNSDMDLEAQFNKLTIFNETDKENASDKDEMVSRPTTPTKDNKALRLLPTNSPNRIPKSPWKPESKEFWDPEVNFAWIDKHSPQREQQPSPKKKRTLMTSKALNLNDAEDLRKHGNSPQKREAKKAFDLAKDEMAQKFLQELDERVTDGRLAQLTTATGGLRTVWSNTLQTTAGRAHWRCKTITSPSSAQGEPAKHEKQHEAYIELAHKVLTNEADLLQTVAHEFCHLATFMLEPAKVAAHGPEFKSWGRKCGSMFGASHGIEVTTKHRYEIDYKFVWRCADCTIEVSRHSRSVDPKRQRCGACKGTLVQIKPKPRGESSKAAAGKDGQDKKAAGAAKPKSAWQQFHSKMMKELSITHKGMTLQQKMEIVSARWKEHQAAEKEKAEKEKQEQEEQQQKQQPHEEEPKQEAQEDDDEEQIQMQLQMEVSQHFEQQQQQQQQQQQEDPEVSVAARGVETLEIAEDVIVVAGGVEETQEEDQNSEDSAAPSLTSSSSPETSALGDLEVSQSEVEVVAVAAPAVGDVSEDSKVFD